MEQGAEGTSPALQAGSGVCPAAMAERDMRAVYEKWRRKSTNARSTWQSPITLKGMTCSQRNETGGMPVFFFPALKFIPCSHGQPYGRPVADSPVELSARPRP